MGDRMKKVVYSVLLICFVMSLLFGNLTFLATKEALTIWFEKLVPAMFISMVFIRLLYHQHVLQNLSMPFLPNILHIDKPAFALVICAMFLGFPNGAVFIDEAYARGELDDMGAKRLLYTCSFATPGFVIMSCGVVFFQSVGIGMLLFLAQLCSGLCLLWFTRHTPIQSKQYTAYESTSIMKSLSLSILETGKALYMIGGYLMVFMSITGVCLVFVPELFAFPIRVLSEFSSGIMLINTLPCSIAIQLYLISFVLGFAGFCVHMQVMSMVSHIRISYFRFFWYRIAQGMLAMLIFTIFFKFIP